jgi:hypothetical protein
VVIHEWLGIGLGIALLLHLTLHWDWVVRTTRRLFSPRGHDKLIWAVNLALLLRNNAFLEAAVIAAVVILDAGYRRLRRARRARTAGGQAGSS